MPDRPPRSIPLRDPGSATLRCAPFRSALGVDPVGSAGSYDAFVCVEVPLPWERDITRSEPFRSLLPPGVAQAASLAGADGRSWRPMGLVPVGVGPVGGPTAEPGSTTVLAFERPVGAPVAPFARREWRVAPDEVAACCRALLAGDAAALDALAHRRVDAGPVVDLLVCTHGRRDVCCGGLGTTLHAALEQELAGDAGVRLWRCSHTGGHRFAPTALTFPDGYAWAGLDVGAAVAVARRSGAVADVLGHCRGSSLVPAGPAQAAEREGLARGGWSWAGAERRVEPLDDGAHRVRGVGLDLVVDVAESGRVPVPACGSREGPGEETEPVWAVTSVRRGTGGGAAAPAQ